MKSCEHKFRTSYFRFGKTLKPRKICHRCGKRGKRLPSSPVDPKTCHHHWHQIEREKYGKVVPLRLECFECETKCDSGDILRQAQLGIIKVRIVYTRGRYPRTPDNICEKIIKYVYENPESSKVEKKYQRWREVRGFSDRPKTKKKFVNALRDYHKNENPKS